MDPLALGLGFGPIAIYLAALGIVNYRRFPLVIAGWKDTAAFMLAFGGLIVVGPINLFFPLPAYFQFGPWVWALLIALYLLAIVSLNLWMKPKIIVYNIPYDDIRPALSELALELDPDARWAGECLSLPNQGIQLYLDYFPLFRNARLVAVGRRQDFQAWAELEKRLRNRLRQLDVGRNWAGVSLLVVGLFLGAMVALGVASQPSQVAEAFDRLFLR
ncbi:MAG: hypothetical protein NZ899_11390 [Thermoguttaceae bacterium]|nr:hypothetical protein [Thermoguttaceae bacterium]MDW8077796.1 hypothetical protein [Thermoguttaceae bacterium]